MKIVKHKESTLSFKESFKFKSPLWRWNFVLTLFSILFFILVNALILFYPIREAITLKLDELGYIPYASSRWQGTKNLFKNILLPLRENNLPLLRLDIKHKHILKLDGSHLENKLERDAVKVPATIKYKNKTIKVKVGHKGQNADHFNSSKASLRMSVKKGKSLFGMREFAIQHPKVRNYLNEWAYQNNLRREDVIGIRYNFVNVSINGSNNGIFAFEEHFSKELLESQNRREGVIVRLSPEQVHLNSHIPLLERFHSDYTNTVAKAHQYKKITRDKTLRMQYQIAQKMLEDFQMGLKPASEIFDVSLIARYMAITELWNACHAQAFTNIRFYYNPITGLLEPIGYDASLWLDSNQLCTFSTWDFGLEFLSDRKIAIAFEQELFRVSSPKYIHSLRNDLQPKYNQLQAQLAKEFPFVPESKALFDVLANRAKLLHKRDRLRTLNDHYENNPKVTKSGISRGDNAYLPEDLPFRRAYGHFSSGLAEKIKPKTLQFRIANSLAEPLNFIGINIESKKETLFVPTGKLKLLTKIRSDQSPLWLPAKRLRRPLEYWDYKFPDDILFQESDPEKIKLLATVKGITDLHVHKTPINYIYIDPLNTGRPQYPLIDSLLKKHPYIKKIDHNNLKIEKGVWLVNENLLVPPGFILHIEQGVTLKFSKNSIFVTSSATRFLGTKDQPIILEPVANKWGGFASLEAGASVWKHVHVNKASNINTNGWELTGGVTFYKTAIDFDGLVLNQSMGEDGLNIVDSSFTLKNCNFLSSVSDAFDGDFSQGRIENCRFQNIRGDGVDFSGSNIQANSLYFENVKDKAVSAGEKSKVDITNLEVINSGVGVASKDGSIVKISKAKFKNIHHFGLAAYVKKNEFDAGGIIEANDITIVGSGEIAKAQIGSQIVINKKSIETVTLDVNQMYSKGFMKK